jgi:hypothetical protein
MMGFREIVVFIYPVIRGYYGNTNPGFAHPFHISELSEIMAVLCRDPLPQL